MSDTVLIVGAGPVGLTMALELARYQVQVRLVEKMTTRSETSRAVAIWPRTLELLDRAGISGELVALGNQVTVANIMAGHKRIARIELDDVETPYPYALMLPQSDTERVLERHLQRFGARSELGVELTGFTQNADGVTATLCHADGGVETQSFDWLIACDGAHSPIRHHLGLAFDGDTRGDDWILGDFHMAGAPFPLNELATYWHADGPLVFFPMAPGRYRLVASLGESGETASAPPTLERFQALVDRRGPGGIVLSDPIWTSAFRINERQIAHYRVGRVFLAGDAAHVHSPAGGQGMNTGMQDAINLAWKLALVCRGKAAAPALLDSYDAERRAVGAEVIAASGHLTNVAMIHGAVKQHLRNMVAHCMLGLAPIQRAIEGSMTEISTGYPASPLNGIAGGSRHSPGSRMPPVAGEAPYGAGDSPLFILRAAASSTGTPAPGWLRELVDPAIRPGAHGTGIELVRPDGYLAMSAPDGEWALVEAYVERLAAGLPGGDGGATFKRVLP
jgi:2-polyprenyl-6-methoxyphenol hydroxylase and related FAD-dependent oxidoreductases